MSGLKELQGKMEGMQDRIGDSRLLRSNTFYQDYKMQYDFCAKKALDLGAAYGKDQVIKNYISNNDLRMDRQEYYKTNYYTSLEQRILSGGQEGLEKYETENGKSYTYGTKYDLSAWEKVGNFFASTIFRPYFRNIEKTIDRDPHAKVAYETVPAVEKPEENPVDTSSMVSGGAQGGVTTENQAADGMDSKNSEESGALADEKKAEEEQHMDLKDAIERENQDTKDDAMVAEQTRMESQDNDQDNMTEAANSKDNSESVVNGEEVHEIPESDVLETAEISSADEDVTADFEISQSRDEPESDSGAMPESLDVQDRQEELLIGSVGEDHSDSDSFSTADAKNDTFEPTTDDATLERGESQAESPTIGSENANSFHEEYKAQFSDCLNAANALDDVLSQAIEDVFSDENLGYMDIVNAAADAITDHYNSDTPYSEAAESSADLVYEVTWGYGHMCTLKELPDIDIRYQNWKNIPLPYIPDHYELKLLGNNTKQYNVIKNIFNKANHIICATDSDREGDLIMDYLYRYMQCKTPYSRAIFYEQSQESFQKAFLPENLVSSTGRLSVIESGRARSTGDFIVGMNLTVACTLKYPNNGVLSIGRVQTAVLNMIVQRENEIHNFKPTPYFVLQGKFATQKGIQYIGTHVSQKIPNAQEAHKLLSKLQNGSHVGVIFNLNTEQIKKKKPYLYDLSTLQMDANKKYGFSLSKTLSLAQKLYENGYITYPRTDSVYLPDDMGEEMQRTIDHLMSLTVYSEYNTGRRVDPLDRHYFDSHKVSSHYAIVPTPKAGMPTGDEGKLYDLIARSVICMLFPDAVFNKTKFQTVVENEVFETTGMTLVSAGFLAVLGVPKDKIIPNVKNGESVTADFEALKKETEPPKRYTDATLLNAMINCGKTLEDEELRRLMAGKPGERPLGLGRPSSQASIVQTLEDRQYIEKKGKTIIPTTKGINLIACFPVQELKSAVMTAQWEKRLDDIENGMDSYESFLSDLQASVRNWTNQVITAPINPILGAGKEGKMTDYTCPICGKKMEEYLNMYGCSGHKEKTCDFKVPKKV